MTKMATKPIYSKKPLNIFFSGSKMPWDLVSWYVALGMQALPGLLKL